MNQSASIIKLFQNNKLYDTSRGIYINGQGIIDLVNRKIDFQVIDNKTKKDITSKLLTKLILEKELNYKDPVPLSFLKELIQSNSSVLKLLKDL